jgi:hypothetical protein
VDKKEGINREKLCQSSYTEETFLSSRWICPAGGFN